MEWWIQIYNRLNEFHCKLITDSAIKRCRLWVFKRRCEGRFAVRYGDTNESNR